MCWYIVIPERSATQVGAKMFYMPTGTVLKSIPAQTQIVSRTHPEKVVMRITVGGHTHLVQLLWPSAVVDLEQWNSWTQVEDEEVERSVSLTAFSTLPSFHGQPRLCIVTVQLTDDYQVMVEQTTQVVRSLLS